MDKIVVFSDVHGNTPALEALFEEFESIRPDLVVNLGDVASGGVDPRGALDLLQAHPEIVTIRGNHDRYLLESDAFAEGSQDAVAAAVLTDEDRAWLGGLPASAEVAPGMLAVHGIPGNDQAYLLETVEPGGAREATPEEIAERLAEAGSGLKWVLCGHSHRQRARYLPGGMVAVNPGSLGLPAFESGKPHPHRMEAGTPHARFTTLLAMDGTWFVTQQGIEYDVERAAALAEANGKPDLAGILRTGRL